MKGVEDSGVFSGRCEQERKLVRNDKWIEGVKKDRGTIYRGSSRGQEQK